MTKAVEYQLRVKKDTHSRGVEIRSAIVDGAAMKAVKILESEGLVKIHWENCNQVCYSNIF